MNCIGQFFKLDEYKIDFLIKLFFENNKFKQVLEFYHELINNIRVNLLFD